MDSVVTKTVKGLPHNNTWAEVFVHRLTLIQDLNRIKCVSFFVNDFVDLRLADVIIGGQNIQTESFP